MRSRQNAHWHAEDYERKLETLEPFPRLRTASLVLRLPPGHDDRDGGRFVDSQPSVLKDSPYVFLLGAVIIISLWWGLGPGFFRHCPLRVVHQAFLH